MIIVVLIDKKQNKKALSHRIVDFYIETINDYYNSTYNENVSKLTNIYLEY